MSYQTGIPGPDGEENGVDLEQLDLIDTSEVGPQFRDNRTFSVEDGRL